jgi:hypothetical protein
MDSEEMVTRLSNMFGIEEQELRTLAAYDLITKTAYELIALVMFLKKHEIMVPENRAKFEKIVRQYLSDLHVITADEADIERLHDAF